MSAYEPTDEQIEELGRAKWQTDTAHALVKHPAFQAIIRAAQAAAWDSGHVAGWDERDADVQEGWMPSGYASDTPNPYREADRA